MIEFTQLDQQTRAAIFNRCDRAKNKALL